MPEPSPEAVEEIFQQAAERDPAERSTLLDELCAGDPDLRAAVEDLLQFDARAELEPEFLQSPAAGVRPEFALSAEPGPPDFIGQFRILRRHGQGGMGTVYEAEQDSPRRTVALKVIRPGLVSSEFLKRFKHEVQILGRLQHPGIAQVYDAGKCEDGRPFFAMEFIRGMPLDEYARNRELNPAARLELTAKVCDAVQHAHDKGVVHRDLKPGNIMVEASGQPKVLDFGVAHVTSSDMLTTLGHTKTGQLLGTLNYMSPEQLGAHPSRLDGRSDVYTLGVILFELLAHRLPYHLDQLPVHEVARVIGHVEPSQLGSIDRLYRGDVAVIVAKALEKDRARRYASAGDLSSDIRRYLRGDAILARKVGAAERSWRWACRNPFIAALGAVLTAVLVVATVVSTLAARRFATLAETATSSANNERAAREEADTARKTAEAAGAAAQAETYRALLSEVQALRAGHQLGWREEALADLSRLATMPTPRRDILELRTEAVATIGELGVKEVARFEVEEANHIVNYLDFSPDSRTLVTVSTEWDLDYWDVPNRKHLRRLAGVAKALPRQPSEMNGAQARFLRDGDLAILSPGERVSFFGPSGQKSARPPIERAIARAVRLAIDRQGRLLAGGRADGSIDVVDAHTGALLRSFAKSPGDFAFSPDGRWIAVQELKGPIRLLSVGGEAIPFTLGHQYGYFPAFAFSPDGVTLASVADRSLVLWNLTSKAEIQRFGGHRESITGVAFSPDGALVATTCLDMKIRIWDVRDGRALAVLPGPGPMNLLAFSPDGGSLAAASWSGSTCLYQITGWREQRRLIGHNFRAQSLDCHPRLPRFASGADDGAVIVWDANEARPLRRLQHTQFWVTGVAYSPDGSLLASARGGSAGPASALVDHSISIWDAAPGTLRKRLHRPDNPGVKALAFDPTGRRLVTGDDGGALLIWDVESGKILRREDMSQSPVTSVAFVSGGRQFIVGQEEGTVALFDLERTGLLRSTTVPSGCTSFALDSRAPRIVAGDGAGGLHALSLPNLAVVHHLADAHRGRILSVALSPDGRLLVTSGNDVRVVLRDARTFEPSLTFPSWTGLVQALKFDVSGRWLAFVGADTDLALWDVPLLHEGLKAAGLAWDEPPPAVVTGSASAHRPRKPG